MTTSDGAPSGAPPKGRIEMRTKAPKIPCPMSGKIGSGWGGYDQCEHCGKMVFIADRDSRVAKHYLPAATARAQTIKKEGAK